MSKLSEDKERVKLEKWMKKHTDELGYKQFMDLLNVGDKPTLEVKMLETAKYQQGLRNLKDADKKLQEAKATVAECNRCHKEDKLATEKRLRLIALAISERFGDKIMDIRPSGQ